MDAAESGALRRVSEVQTQVARMLQDPRATAAATSMFQQWLGTGGTLSKADPAFNAKLNASMMAEVAAFVSQGVWSGGHGYPDLFTSPTSFIDGNVAALYGIAAPRGQGMVQTTLDPAKHAGVLTMPGFIATYYGATYRAPIQLGHFVRSRIFCQELMPPPNNVPQPPSDPNLDEHQRFAEHDSNPACASCHTLMDPIGYGWSEYDTLGRFSPADHGVTEDGSGTLAGTDVDGPFKGPVELGKKIAASAQAQACFARTVLTWGLGRQASTDATSSDAQALPLATASGFATGDVKALFAALATADSFRFRDTTNVPQGGH
jgi:hypothetical protein